MNKIHAAYQKLGAHPGTEFDVIKRRYKMLVMVWHPDRLTTPEGKKVAEEEIKSINNAFDCLKKHFESGHRQGPVCECQPAIAQNQQTGAGHNQNASSGHSAGNGQTGSSQGYSGGYQREKTAYEKWAEQEARAQESERRRRAEEAAHEATLREALERARQAAEAQATTAAAAKAKSQAAAMPMTEEQLRWRVSIALGIIFLFLLIGGFNRRYEPSSRPNSEFSLSATVEHLRPSPFLN